MYSTAGKTTIADAGAKLLVAGGAAGPMLIRTRVAEVRRPLLSVKDMTKNGYNVLFSPSGAFAHRPAAAGRAARTVQFQSTPAGWDHCVELEAPSRANKIVNELSAMKKTEAVEEVAPANSLPMNLPKVIEEAMGLVPARPGFQRPGPRQ